MNEEQKRELIEKYGYSYIPGVGITDANNNLVEELNIEDQTFKSEMSPQEFQRVFKQERVDPKEDIRKMREHPYLYNREKFNTPEYKQAYGEIADEDRQETGSSFTSPEDEFQEKRKENNPLLEFLASENEQNRLLFLDERISQIENLDPDNITQSEKNEEAQKEEITNNSAYMGFEKSLQRGVRGLTHDIYRFFQDPGDGMKDEELRREYENLIDERNILLRPAAERLKEQLEEKEKDIIQGINQTFENNPNVYTESLVPDALRFSSTEEEDKAYDEVALHEGNRKKISKIKNDLQDFIDGKNYDSNIFSAANAEDWLSIGIGPAYELFTQDLPLINKISEEGFDYSTLSKAEKDRLELINLESDVQNQDLQYSGWRGFSAGLNETGKFMASTATTGGFVAKLGTKGIKEATSKIIKESVRNKAHAALAGTTYVLGQSLGSASTYKYMAENYIGEVEPLYDEEGNFEGFAARERAYNILSDEIKNSLESIRTAKLQTEDPSELKQLQDTENDLLQYKNSLKEPPGILKSIGYGVTENIIEHAAERFGGKLLPKFKTSKATRMQRALDKAKRTKTGKFFEKGSSAFNKFMNNRSGYYSGNLIGGVGEEYYEELLVQAAYNPFSDESYSEKISQLSELDFHLDVLGQTLAIKGGASITGALTSPLSISEQLRETRKELRNIEKNLKKKNITQDEVHAEMVRLGVNPKLTEQEYNNAINQEKDPKRKQEILSEAYKNKVDQALKIGSLDTIERTFIQAHGNLKDPQNAAAVLEALQYVEKVKEYKNSYRNPSEIAKLDRGIEKLKESDSILSARRSDLQPKIAEELAMHIEKFESEDPITNETFVDNPKFMEYLQSQSMTDDLLDYIASTKHKNIKAELLKAAEERYRYMTSFDFQQRLDDVTEYQQEAIKYGKENSNLSAEEISQGLEDFSKGYKNIPQEYKEMVNKSIVPMLEDVEIASEPVPEKAPTERAINLAEAVLDSEENLPPSNATPDDFDFSPSNTALNKLKDWAKTFEFEEERKPSVVDAINDVKSLSMSMNDTRSYVESLFDLWEHPQGMNEKLQREELMNSHVVGRVNILAEALNIDKGNLKQDSDPKKTVTSDDDGQPIVVEYDEGSEYLQSKVAYKAVESTTEKTVFKDEDGNSYIIAGEKDSQNPENVSLIDDGRINHKVLKDPNRTQIGDKLTTHPVMSPDAWGDILFTLRDEGGIPISEDNYTFLDWVTQRVKDLGLNIDDFTKTQEFKDRVPIIFRDKNGNNVGYVPDVGYYTPYTVKDTSKEEGDQVFIYNPSEFHKELLEIAQEEARRVRAAILEGKTNYLIIDNISPSPSYYIDEPKPINEEFENSEVVIFNGNEIQDLKGDLKNVRIRNIEELRENGNMVIGVLSPIAKQEDGEIEYELLNTRPNTRPETIDKDVDTVRYILAAYNTLNNKETSKSQYALTPEESEIINDFVKSHYGFSLNSSQAYNRIQEIVFKPMLTNVLENGDLDPDLNSIWQDDIVRQTYVRFDSKPPAQISKDGGNLLLETPYDSYEDYVKDRRTIGIRGFEVGTEENPIQTHMTQPVVSTSLGSGNIESQEAQDNIISEEPFEPIINEEVNQLDQELKDLIGTSYVDGDLSPAVSFSEDVIAQSMGYLNNLSLEEQMSVQEEIKNLINIHGNNSEKVKKELNKILNSTRDALVRIQEKYSELGEESRSKFVKTQVNKIDTIKEYYSDLYQEAYEDIRQKNIKPDQSEEDEIYEKDYSKGSNEIIHKEKLSQALRKVMLGLKTGNKTVGGVEKRDYTFDAIYNTVFTRLIESFPPDPTWSSMKNKLISFVDDYDWMQDLINKLDSNKDLQNQFVTHGYKFLAKAIFVNMSLKNGIMNSDVLQSNSSEIKQMLRDEFNKNLEVAPLTKGGILQKDIAKQLSEDYEGIISDPKKARLWLTDFGIYLSDKTWNTIQKKGLVYWSGTKVIRTNYKNLFNPKNKTSLFTALKTFIDKVAEANTDIPFGTTDQNNPLRYVFTPLKGIIEEEAKQRADLISVSRYSGGKVLSEIEMPSYFFEKVRDIKLNENYRNNLRKDLFSQKSIVLDILEKDDKAFSRFNYFTIDNNSLKVNGIDKGRVDKLTSQELGRLFRALSQEDKKKRVKLQDKFGLPWRMAKMPTLTNSDKGRIMVVEIPIIDILGDPKLVSINNKLELQGFSKELQEMLWEALVAPELNRIVNSKAQNVKNYNNARKYFTIFPFLNEVANGDLKAHEFLAKEGATSEAFKEKYYGVIQSAFKKYIETEVKKNQKLVKKLNRSTGEEVEKLESVYNNKAALSPSEKRVAEYDYVINSLFANVNIMQMISGDPAQYAKKRLKNNDFLEFSRQLDIEMGKRMAAMIAPGIVGSNANEKYMQIALSDDIEEASNIIKLANTFYDISEKDEDLIRKDNKSEEELRELQDKFPKIAGYFEIEVTDAQEYTTVKEHLKILRNYGKISEKEYEEITNFYNSGGDILMDSRYSNLVLQPIKPVYTGEVFENGIKRFIYVKSSSFPLFPSIHKKGRLGGLLAKMERLEKDNPGMTVRASYQTANKLGAPLKTESVDEISEDLDVTASTVILDRKNFKIQQEVPNKSAKEGDDRIIRGSQLFKMMFGNDVLSIPEGKELAEEFKGLYDDYVNNKRKDLLQELEMDENYNPLESPYSTAKKVQRLLKKEAKDRNLSPEDIKALDDLLQTPEGFTTSSPLWLLGDSQKLETMLNAIIKNRIFVQKWPGVSFVAGSEAGFRFEEGVPSGIIPIGDYNGEPLKDNEILVPSRFKYNGKLIDLYEKDGLNNYIYLDEKGRIKENMIDSDLFNHITYRIPTSSHASAASVKVVGFLPKNQGDLIIASKNLITQMGQDFDVDKLYTYGYHHVVRDDGRIKKLEATDKKRWMEDNQYLDITSSQERDLLFEIALQENRMIEIYNEVYNLPQMQKRIKKQLSTSNLEKHADNIDARIRNRSLGWSFASGNHQADKIIKASSGGSAIGIYAKTATLIALAQQSPKKPVILDPKSRQRQIFTIGGVEYGDLGRIKSSDGQDIADVIDQKIQTAVDDEKVQVLRRVNLLSNTSLGIDALMTAMGINNVIEDGVEYNLPYLIHNHPVVKEYLDNPHNPIWKAYEGASNVYKNITGKNLSEALLKNPRDSKGFLTDVSREVISLYINLAKTSSSLVESNLLLDASEFGLTARDRQKMFYDLVNLSSLPLSNLESFFGKVSTEEGQIYIGKYLDLDMYFTPNSIQATVIGQAVSAGRNLFENLFPVYDQNMNSSFQVISDYLRVDPLTEFKAYALSSPNHLVFEGSASQERARLLRKGKDSFAQYLASLMYRGQNQNVDIVKNNKFMKALQFDFSDKNYDFVNFRNNTNTTNTKRYFTNALKDLIIKNENLPNFQGKPYTTRMLARDLVSYSHITAGISNRVGGFHNLIPYEYYKSLSVDIDGNSYTSLELRENFMPHSQMWKNPNFWKNFIVQAAQQHGGNVMFTRFKDLQDMISDSDKPLPKIVRTRVDGVEKLLMLSEQNTYVELQRSSTSTIPEYDVTQNTVTPAFLLPRKETNDNPRFSLESEDIRKILSQVKSGERGEFAKFALENFPKVLDNITVINSNEPAYEGRYRNGVIEISSSALNPEQTFMHELGHALTVEGLKPYFESDERGINWEKPKVNAPASVIKLFALMQDYRKKAGDPSEISDKVELSEEDRIIYAGKNIKEFIAAVYEQRPEVAKFMRDTKYKSTESSFKEKFKEILNEFLSFIAGKDVSFADLLIPLVREVTSDINPEVKNSTILSDVKGEKKLGGINDKKPKFEDFFGPEDLSPNFDYIAPEGLPNIGRTNKTCK